MNSVEFAKVMQEQLDRVDAVLGKKAEEYATDDERLHNFKTAAALQNITVRQAVVNFMTKHTISICDLVQLPYNLPKDLWDEKITDHINYLILLQAALAEERQVEEKQNTDISVSTIDKLEPTTIRTPAR